MDWLRNSQDLNPIVNWWNEMNKLKDVNVSSLPQLKDALLKLWTQELSNGHLATLRASIPKRIATIIKSGRDMTKYNMIHSSTFFFTKHTIFNADVFLGSLNYVYSSFFWNHQPVLFMNSLWHHSIPTDTLHNKYTFYILKMWLKMFMHFCLGLFTNLFGPFLITSTWKIIKSINIRPIGWF